MKFIDDDAPISLQRLEFCVEEEDALVMRAAYRQKHEASKRLDLEPPFPAIDVDMRAIRPGYRLSWDIREPVVQVDDVIETLSGYRDAVYAEQKLAELFPGNQSGAAEIIQLQRTLDMADRVIGALALGRDVTLFYQQGDWL